MLTSGDQRVSFCYDVSMTRPHTTLFLLESLDGKISTGESDERDLDKDMPFIKGVCDGRKQYDDLEQETDLCSLNSGKVMAKIGWNDVKESIEKIPASFVIIDNKPHLTELGISNLLKRTRKLYIVTTNAVHPARHVDDTGLEVFHFDGKVNFEELFEQLYTKGEQRITLQSGGELNAVLLRAGMVDEVSIVIAPMLVGGRNTPTLVDGESLLTKEDLSKVKPLKLREAKTLNNSYLHLSYDVVN